MVTILAFGGAHIDKRGTLQSPFTAGSSHPGVWREEAGGGAFNAARNLSRLGHHVTFISPRGGDAAAEIVSIAAEIAGIDDRPFTFLDRKTASYTAILDDSGILIVGLADMALYDLFTPRRLRIRSVRNSFDSCDAILVDANLPTETLLAIAKHGKEKGKTIAALGISPAKVSRLKEAFPFIDMLFINQAEAKELTGATEASKIIAQLKSLGLRGAVITNGEKAINAYRDDMSVSLLPPNPQSIVDVTGAGDALCGAFFSAHLKGADLQMALRDGVAAALITIASPHAFAPDLTDEKIASTLFHVAQPKLTLSS